MIRQDNTTMSPFSSSGSSQPFNYNMFPEFWAENYTFSQDKRLAPSLCSDQPCHLKIGKPLSRKMLIIRNSTDNCFAGYNPYRGDFATEHDNNAERLIVLASQLGSLEVQDKDEDVTSKNEQKLLKKLQFALIGQYNTCLGERKRRKDILKKHGFMNVKGTARWFSRLETTIGKSNAKKIVHLCSIINPDEIEYLSASLEAINNKRAEVNKLSFYRTQRGILTQHEKDAFDLERMKREVDVERTDIRNLVVPTTVKRRKKSLDIFHFPRYKDLKPKEVELCRSNGLEPSCFLDIKDTLITDCKKNNGLLLKKARKLIRKDVNKTRKVYDLLLEEGDIWTPE